MKELNLNSFPSVTKTEWQELAKKQLKGTELSSLNWTVSSPIESGPYYDNSDTHQLKYLTKFFEEQSPFQWKLYEQIKVSNDEQGNAEALEALAGGCDGVIFEIENEVNVELLLKDIILDICDIHFLDPHGKLEMDHLPKNIQGVVISKQPIQELLPPEDSINFIINALQDLEPSQVIYRSISGDFFFDIASLRALRYLITEVKELDPFSIHIHSHIPQHPSLGHQWFLNTTSGLASILGGSTSLGFSTAQGNPRISRNVGNLFREEAKINEYTDQCGGSYYIEWLTHSIIQECKKRLK